ncbi:MAG: PEP/pyruvate-binding domain-containing protein [Patescibacteria group bacterium]|jgi:pyruvate,water dikinase
MSKNVLPFSKISKKDVRLAGGKGANLGQLVRAKFPVPPGFVVSSTAFESFMEEADLSIEVDKWLHKLNPKNVVSIDRASHELRDAIRRAQFPEKLGQEITEEFNRLGEDYVAVRSSATAEDSSVASWAGELESYMYVTEKKLLGTIKICWSSLFTPRAIFYRFEKKLHDTPVSVAVVVQKMVNSEVAGITFTAHPVTKDRNQMVIEAGWGQGESIVSGKITPDTYIYDKVVGALIDINVSTQAEMIVSQGAAGTKIVKVPKKLGAKQKLSGEKIMEIAALCGKIEKHYKSPQDIEWAFEKNKFYITQTRPITTL